MKLVEFKKALAGEFGKSVDVRAIDKDDKMHIEVFKTGEGKYYQVRYCHGFGSRGNERQEQTVNFIKGLGVEVIDTKIKRGEFDGAILVKIA